MQAAFDYSWRLLDEHERWVLRRLSIFEGGFQREAAEQVAGLSLSSLAGLMDNSLVLKVEHGRYSLHDLVHKYGFVKLKENLEEMQATLEKHCCYYGDLLQPFVYRLKGRNQAELSGVETHPELTVGDICQLAAGDLILRQCSCHGFAGFR